jgi:hypothetical protein
MRLRLAFHCPDRRSASSEFDRRLGLACRLILGLVLTASLCSVAPCRAAGLIIQALNSTALPGSSGTFNVVLENTNPTGGTSYDVSNDSLDLKLSGPTGIQFTSVTIDTNPPYPYIYVSPASIPAGGLSLDKFPNTQFTASDSETASPFFRTVHPGDVFGLAHVSYSIGPTVAIGSTATISIESINVGTSLSDINGALIPFTAVNGTVSVGVVPEPSTLILGTIDVLIGLGALGWQRRKRSAVGSWTRSRGDQW